MDALTQEDSRRARKFLLDLVIHIADEAVPEAIKRLDDKRWFVKRNMLFIISESSNREALPYVRPYCYHENLKLSFHALKYLLKADERYGIEVLKRYLRSGTSDKVEMALGIAVVFGIKTIVPELIAMLEKTAKRGSDWEQRIAIVKALGHIGDPRALNVLKNILDAKSLFFRTHLRRLKEEVRAALKSYPPEDVRIIIGTIPEEKQLTGVIKLNGGPSSVAAPDDNRAKLSTSLLHNQEVPHGT
jgi:HEAT repeat protein